MLEAKELKFSYNDNSLIENFSVEIERGSGLRLLEKMAEESRHFFDYWEKILRHSKGASDFPIIPVSVILARPTSIGSTNTIRLNKKFLWLTLH